MGFLTNNRNNAGFARVGNAQRRFNNLRQKLRKAAPDRPLAAPQAGGRRIQPVPMPRKDQGQRMLPDKKGQRMLPDKKGPPIQTQQPLPHQYPTGGFGAGAPQQRIQPQYPTGGFGAGAPRQRIQPQIGGRRKGEDLTRRIQPVPNKARPSGGKSIAARAYDGPLRPKPGGSGPIYVPRPMPTRPRDQSARTGDQLKPRRGNVQEPGWQRQGRKPGGRGPAPGTPARERRVGEQVERFRNATTVQRYGQGLIGDAIIERKASGDRGGRSVIPDSQGGRDREVGRLKPSTGEG